MTDKRDPRLDLKIREAVLEALREKQAPMTDHEVAAATGYRLEWVREILQLLASEEQVVVTSSRSDRWDGSPGNYSTFQTVVRLPPDEAP